MKIDFKNIYVLDCEVYRNYFLLLFKNLENGKTKSLEVKGESSCVTEKQKQNLIAFIENNSTFGFNSLHYDLVMIYHLLNGASCYDIYTLSCQVISGDRKDNWDITGQIKKTIPRDLPHFDIKDILPMKSGLKSYASRIHTKILQTLPIPPHKNLSEGEMATIKEYCKNDLDMTIDLYRAIEPDVMLRRDMSEQYKCNLMSFGDAKIAEKVITSEVERLQGSRIGRQRIDEYDFSKEKLYYKQPEFISFVSDEMKEFESFLKEEVFTLNDKGYVKPKHKEIDFGGLVYKTGVGGLHSQEKNVSYHSTEEKVIFNVDVASFYPSIVLNLGLYPSQMGEDFLQVYRKITEKRLEAKRKGDKKVSDSLKIVINGTYGKFSSCYSTLYSPNCMLHVVLTGQLSLLMLIEMLHLKGVPVVSANTDGVVVYFDKEKIEVFRAVCKEWEEKTNFLLEEEEYKALYCRDVNAYIAITDKGCKGKGIYSKGTIMGNLKADIVNEAVFHRLEKGKPIMETLKECKDIKKFLLTRSTSLKNTGEILWKDENYGNVVRFYYSKEGTYMIGDKKGNKIPDTDFSRPLKVLPDDFPSDIDYEIYCDFAEKRIEDFGIKDHSKQQYFF